MPAPVCWPTPHLGMMDFTAIGAKRDREAEFYKLSCLGAIRFQIGRLSLSLSPLLFFWHLVCCRPAFYDAPIIRENAASAVHPSSIQDCRSKLNAARAEGDRCSLLWTFSTTLERTFCLLFQCRTRPRMLGPNLLAHVIFSTDLSIVYVAQLRQNYLK